MSSPWQSRSGAACSEGAECEKARCAGQGCGPGEGVCIEAQNVTCTGDMASEICLCTGETSLADVGCIGVRYEHLGACEAP